ERVGLAVVLELERVPPTGLGGDSLSLGAGRLLLVILGLFWCSHADLLCGLGGVRIRVCAGAGVRIARPDVCADQLAGSQLAEPLLGAVGRAADRLRVTGDGDAVAGGFTGLQGRSFDLGDLSVRQVQAHVLVAVDVVDDDGTAPTRLAGNDLDRAVDRVDRRAV